MRNPSFALLALLVVSIGCEPERQSDLPTTRMQIGDRRFTLEIADDPVERAVGLMRRDALPDDHGMIFVFPDEAERSFWMKNTRIPLDILFLETDGDVVSIKQMAPHVGTADSDGPARYAVELNKGAAADAGAKPGDRLDLPADVRQLAPAE